MKEDEFKFLIDVAISINLRKPRNSLRIFSLKPKVTLEITSDYTILEKIIRGLGRRTAKDSKRKEAPSSKGEQTLQTLKLGRTSGAAILMPSTPPFF